MFYLAENIEDTKEKKPQAAIIRAASLQKAKEIAEDFFKEKFNITPNLKCEMLYTSGRDEVILFSYV